MRDILKVTPIPPRGRKMTAANVRAEAEAIHAAYPGRIEPCDFMTALRACPLKGNALREAYPTFPGYAAKREIVQSLLAAEHLYTGAALIECQLFWTGQLTAQSFEKFGRTAQAVILDRGAGLVTEVWPALIAWFATGHRQPKAWFANPRVLAVVPDDEAIADLLTALPHPGRRDLAGVRLRGRRAALNPGSGPG